MPEMDADLSVVFGYIEDAYCHGNEDKGFFVRTLEKEDREKLFQALLSLSKRLKFLENR